MKVVGFGKGKKIGILIYIGLFECRCQGHVKVNLVLFNEIILICLHKTIPYNIPRKEL